MKRLAIATMILCSGQAYSETVSKMICEPIPGLARQAMSVSETQPLSVTIDLIDQQLNDELSRLLYQELLYDMVTDSVSTQLTTDQFVDKWHRTCLSE